ncbi:MAG: matrixin family metalloprotease [Lacipirellulaceae bacterium]
MVLLCAVAYAAAVEAACGCFSCLTGGYCAVREEPLELTPGEAEPSVPYAEFRVNDRWTRTAASGSNARRGDPITVTWGIVADGTTITGNEGSSPSNLIAMLNTQYGAGPGGVADAPWFRLFTDSFRRWDELSGVTYVYEPADGGQPIDSSTTPSGARGVYADVRIGGHSIDGDSGSNTLAYNYFPDHSDMVIDTDNASFYGNRERTSVRLRNVLMHEAGHGLGFEHLESTSGSFLMEPFISSGFDGPQLDDVLAVQRNYGDPLEEAGGNDSVATATLAGAFSVGQQWAIGTNGDSAIVQPTQRDFVSIDGLGDTDLFRFTVTTPVTAQLVLRQRGAVYQEGAQGGPQTSLDARRINPLTLALEREDTRTNIVVASGTPLTGGLFGQSIRDTPLMPGFTYYARVRGTIDNVQLYGLQLVFTPIPEPATALGLVLLAACAAGGRRAG